MSSKSGRAGSKARSQDHILEKPCVFCKGHMFLLILKKLGQNFCRDDFLDKCDIG